MQYAVFFRFIPKNLYSEEITNDLAVCYEMLFRLEWYCNCIAIVYLVKANITICIKE